MTDEKIQLIIGGLLHDIGKVIYRQGDRRKHSISGYDFLKEYNLIQEPNILNAVKYHHGKELATANIEKESFAYITYTADNIAAAADRRKTENEDTGFDMTRPLEPVFNILNGNDKKMYYHKAMLGDGQGINYPTETKETFDEHFYLTVKRNLLENLKGIEWTKSYINSLLEILEANLSYIPSSTAKDEVADISLFDHVKLTAAIGSCIYDYLAEKKIQDYQTYLFKRAEKFYEEKAFVLYSMDISGIQDFIYTIHSEGALKTLRARSFYLEIMMEHMIDTLLERMELSRANLIYSGGGHCYILLPNTQHMRETVAELEEELNDWFIKQYDIALYVAVGFGVCSANDLKNYPAGSYSDVFSKISDMIIAKKAKRYNADKIRKLNGRKYADRSRECKVCKRVGNLDEAKRCSICAAIENMSKDVLNAKFFSIVKEQKDKLPLPFGYSMVAYNVEKTLREVIKQDNGYCRIYGKNKMFSGKNLSAKLWVGDYHSKNERTFEELAKKSEGVERIGILRADVDNLGKTFISGFENKKNGDKYVTLSRTATLSRQLSLFFKYHINAILEKPEYFFWKEKKESRNAAIVYSGGDDLFIVGAWDDILSLAVDIHDALKKYTEGRLTLSAGIGIYQPTYPISVSAVEVAELEDDSKTLPGKNAVTFLPDGFTHEDEESKLKISDGTYSWDVFVEEVLKEKFAIISEFFQKSEDSGKSFLYHLLELVRNQEEKINLARFVYLLARMEPGEKASPQEKELYKKFSKNMYEWIRNEKERRQVKTAITLYAYTIRDKEEQK